jgi:alpha-L-fucosidase 2
MPAPSLLAALLLATCSSLPASASLAPGQPAECVIRAMFNRVSLQLEGTDAALAILPTDARLAAVRKGGDDPGWVALYFQFGRYLIMNSSRRPARLPASLQGIWGQRLWLPWEADYHLNINLQIN